MTRLPVRNPRSGLVDHHFDAPSREALAARLAALRGAQRSWRRDGVRHRIAALERFRRELLARRAAVLEALCADTGRLQESVLEFDNLLGAMDRWCALAPGLVQAAAPRSTSLPSIEMHQRLHAIPVVGVISPWNFPLLLAFEDALPALLAGSAVCVKPSEITPRWVEPVAEALHASEALAPVLHLAPGGPGTGEDLVDLADAVCFTGSTRTGRRVARAAAERLIPAFLELGGKDAAIVTEDIDPARTADALVWGSMVNAGQSCLSLERAYLNAAVAEELEGALVTRARSLDLNLAAPGEGEIGPVIRAEQAAVIARHIEDARDRGARVLCGGELVEHGGIWCRPTIIAGATPDMAVMREETSGPVLALARVGDDAEALAAANASSYGLSGAVFCRDRQRARDLGERLHCGGVSINDAALTALVQEGEKVAFGESGLGGSRMGPAGLTRFLRKQLLLECTDERHAPWWFIH